jgi:predicted PurR-regulated permease PerM
MARNLQKDSHDVEKLGDDGTAPAVAVKGPPLSTFLFSGTRALVAGLLTVVVLLFFLLVSGNSFLRRIVEILPTLHDKNEAVHIINEIQRTIAVYLGTVTMMNAVVGLLTAWPPIYAG